MSGSRNFEIGSRDPGHAHLGVSLCSERRKGPCSICVPNLKLIALFVQTFWGGVPKFRNWVTWPRIRPLRSQFMFRTQEGSVVDFCTEFEVGSFICSKVMTGDPKFRNWVTWPRPRLLRGQFMFRTQEGSVLDLCTKLEVYSIIRSKVMRVVPKFRNWVTSPRPRPLRGQFMFRTQEGSVLDLCT